jgi:hypothetical protein
MDVTTEAGRYEVFRIFNLWEGCLWIGFGITFACVLARKRQHAGLMAPASLLFLAFGVSDFVEIKTGGWYTPWWLLLWKASCLVGFAVLYGLFCKGRASKRKEAVSHSPVNSELSHNSPAPTHRGTYPEIP